MLINFHCLYSVPGPAGLPGADGICTQECKPTQQVAFFAGLSTNVVRSQENVSPWFKAHLFNGNMIKKSNAKH